MKTINIPCPSCKSAAGERCIDIGYGDQPKNVTGFHLDRAARARAITGVENSERGRARRAAMGGAR